jgi:predicted membrane-bound mannosyltransferase
MGKTKPTPRKGASQEQEKTASQLDFTPVYATEHSTLENLPLWWVVIAGVFSVLFFYAYFYDLDAKIQHHDEGVNILIMEDMFTGYPYKYKYDPENYHGPALYFFSYWYTLANAYLTEVPWEKAYDHGLTVFVSRCVTVTGGLALIFSLLFGLRNRVGNAGALLAFILGGCCTDFVWISRYYIHEIFVTLFVAQM